MNRRSLGIAPPILALALSNGCAPEEFVGKWETSVTVNPTQIGDAWVFTYEERPDLGMEALHSGPAAVVDGCLEVDGAIVVWYDHHLDTVGDILAGLDEGRTVEVTLGGGGASLDEGSTLDDFPADIVERCSPSFVWYANGDDVTVVDGA